MIAADFFGSNLNDFPDLGSDLDHGQHVLMSNEEKLGALLRHYSQIKIIANYPYA